LMASAGLGGGAAFFFPKRFMVSSRRPLKRPASARKDPCTGGP
jgi:hypothetical protein